MPLKRNRAWMEAALEVARAPEQPDFEALSKKWKVDVSTAKNRWFSARIELSTQEIIPTGSLAGRAASVTAQLELLSVQVALISDEIQYSLSFLDRVATEMTPAPKPGVGSRKQPPRGLWQWITDGLATVLTTKGLASILGTDVVTIEGWLKGKVPDRRHQTRLRTVFASVWAREDFMDFEEARTAREAFIKEASKVLEY